MQQYPKFELRLERERGPVKAAKYWFDQMLEAMEEKCD
jgi:hypothetical protein